MRAETAQLHERINEVQRLGQSDSLKVLPRLATIDRSVSGYLTLFGNWLLGWLIWGGLLLLATAATIGFLLATTVVIGLFFELTTIIAAQSYLISVATPLLIVAVLALRFHKESDRRLEISSSSYRAVRLILYPLRLLMIWVVAGYRFVIWSPVVVLALLGGEIWLLQAAKLVVVGNQPLVLLTPWHIPLGLVLSGGLIVWGISRGWRRSLLVVLVMLLVITGSLRVMTLAMPLVQQISLLQAPAAVALPGQNLIGAVVLIGIAALIGIFAILRMAVVGAYNRLARLNIWVVDVLKLHFALHHAFKAHRRRHTALVGTKSAQALCTACISRLKQAREQLSYGRRFTYAHCQKCETDQHCVPNILSVEGIVNGPQPGHAEHSRAAVHGQRALVQMNSYLVSNDHLPSALTAITFQKASSRDIETFILRYRIQEADRLITPRGSFICQLTSETDVREGQLANLKKMFGRNLRVEHLSLQETGETTP